MTERARALLDEALALPLEDRANVAAELLASLDDLPTEDDAAAVQAAWAQEIERRARRVLSGESSGEPWDAVRERTARRLAEQ
jgi:putative addiction module component (TIGR02574 family)